MMTSLDLNLDIEADAVKKSLLLCGFRDCVTSWVHEDPELVVYIPMHQTTNFRQVIEYFDHYVFSKEPNVKERLQYYRFAKRARNHYEAWKERECVNHSKKQ
jgi:hypothetical protein